MKYEIVELGDLSGRQGRIYSIIEQGQSNDLFSNFVQRWKDEYPDEIQDIVNRIWQIGNKFGAKEGYFRHHEGRPGDGVCALFDIPGSKLRLFCIRYGNLAIILGDGGPKKVRTWEEDPHLKREAERIIALARDINRRLRLGDDLYWSVGGTDLLGNLKNDNDEEDE